MTRRAAALCLFSRWVAPPAALLQLIRGGHGPRSTLAQTFYCGNPGNFNTIAHDDNHRAIDDLFEDVLKAGLGFGQVIFDVVHDGVPFGRFDWGEIHPAGKRPV